MIRDVLGFEPWKVTLLAMDPAVAASPRSVDVALHRRLLDGDSAALAAVYDIHATAIYRIALRVLRDSTMAEDIIQEVLVSLWTQPDRFDPGRGSLRTYLSMITHRRSIDLIRSNEARRAREQRVHSQPASPPSVEDRVVASIESRSARESLACLPVEQRECLVLAYLDGLTFREVASHLGIPEGTAKSRIRLGLKGLHSAMKTARSSRGGTQ